MPDDQIAEALRGPWHAVLSGPGHVRLTDPDPASVPGPGRSAPVAQIAVVRGPTVPAIGEPLPIAFAARDLYYAIAWFRDAADVASRWAQAQHAAALLNLAATAPPWHLIELRDTGWTIEHPLSCRLRSGGLFACPFNQVARITGPARGARGVYRCDLDAAGHLVLLDPAGQVTA